MAGHIAVRVGDRVVVAGEGWPLGVGHTWIYSLKSKTWTKGTPMPHPRSFASAVEWRGRVLVMGGLDAKANHSDRIDAYDIQQDKWSAFSRLPHPMTRTAALVWKGKLYLSGGFNGTSDRAKASNSASLFRFEEATKTWKELAPMPTPRHGHCLVAFQDRLWAIGGAGNSVSREGPVESYDPVVNKWRKEASFSGSRIFGGAGVFGGRLVFFGAIDGSRHPIEWSAKSWIPRPSRELERRRFAYVIEGGQAIVFGGEPSDPFLVEFAP